MNDMLIQHEHRTHSEYGRRILKLPTLEPHFVSPVGPSTPPQGKKNELMRRQYQDIGRALVAAENGCFSFAIPCMLQPPWLRTSRDYQGPLAEYLRYALVTVSTKTLESYCDDLEMAPPDNESAKELCLSYPNVVQRYSFCGMLFVTVLLLASGFGHLLNLGSTSILVTSISSALAAALIASPTCMEVRRRACFHWALTNEILRRKGMDQEGRAGVKLYTLDAEG